jgi:hypothetical protein
VCGDRGNRRTRFANGWQFARHGGESGQIVRTGAGWTMSGSRVNIPAVHLLRVSATGGRSIDPQAAMITLSFAMDFDRRLA